VDFGVGLFALRATKPPQAVPMRSEALTSGVAFRATHCFLGLYFALHDSIIQLSLVVYKRKIQFAYVFFSFIFNGLRVKMGLLQKRGKAPKTASLRLDATAERFP
jgi:hypothetical protein